jgi:hypothetical protein
MKKLLLAVGFFGALALLYYWLTMPRSTPVYLSPGDQISKQEKPKPQHPVYGLIKQINDRNAKVRTVYVQNVDIRLQRKITVKATGELAFEKNKKFRLQVWHRLTGKEVDVGSNDEVFWFWSKRMDPPALHYARHEDLKKAMLKTPLNPAWMMESLNVGQIDAANIQVGDFKGRWAVLRPRTSASGEPVTVMTLIDPQKVVIVGRYLYNQQGKMVVSTETQDWYQDPGTQAMIPRNLLIIWYEEGVVMEWNFHNPQVNTGINPQYWVMPAMRNKIDMGR